VPRYSVGYATVGFLLFHPKRCSCYPRNLWGYWTNLDQTCTWCSYNRPPIALGWVSKYLLEGDIMTMTPSGLYARLCHSFPAVLCCMVLFVYEPYIIHYLRVILKDFLFARCHSMLETPWLLETYKFLLSSSLSLIITL